MSKPLKQLSKKWVFPITMPKATQPCGCCKSEIHPINHAHLERYDSYYCDRVCFITAMGMEYVGDGVERVCFEGLEYSVTYLMKDLEAREYG